jgi:hypothetical protein
MKEGHAPMSTTAPGTPARLWLIYADDELYGDYHTEADQLAALPGAIATAGTVTTSHWADGRWTEPEPVSSCPPWCKKDHRDDPPLIPRSHFGHIGSTHLSGKNSGPVSVFLRRDGEAGRELITVRSYAGHEITLTIEPGQADGVARLTEMLATATWDEHQALAAAIRQATLAAKAGHPAP